MTSTREITNLQARSVPRNCGRLSEMVRRILRSKSAVGLDMWGPPPEVDMAAHNQAALETARQGIVLPENDGALPLSASEPLKIAVIGG